MQISCHTRQLSSGTPDQEFVLCYTAKDSSSMHLRTLVHHPRSAGSEPILCVFAFSCSSCSEVANHNTSENSAGSFSARTHCPLINAVIIIMLDSCSPNMNIRAESTDQWYDAGEFSALRALRPPDLPALHQSRHYPRRCRRHCPAGAVSRHRAQGEGLRRNTGAHEARETHSQNKKGTASMASANSPGCRAPFGTCRC